MAHLNEDIIMGGRGGFAGGFGGDGGILSGLILGSLLNRGNGLFGDNRDNRGACSEPCATVSDLTQQTLGDIKASIPYNEAQVQLALAGAVASLSSQANNDTQHIIANTTAGQIASAAQASRIELATANTAANLARDIAAVDTNVDRTATAIQMAISADGEKTRALITSNQIAELNQKLTVAQLDGLELRQRNERDRERHNVEITMTNNQNQNQLQFQQQSQQLNTLTSALVDALQSIRSTNQAINIGSGRQTANPDNNNTNVRA
jgi:hypothetical protein